MGASIQIRGGVDVRRRLLAVKRAGVAGIAAGVEDLTRQISARAQSYAPVETGALRDSIQPTPVTVGPSFISGAVTAGDAATADYAVRQHEDLTLYHPNGGSAKFLELAMMDYAGGTGNAIVGAKARQRVEAV